MISPPGMTDASRGGWDALIGLTTGATETDGAKELAAAFLKSAHSPSQKSFLFLCELPLLPSQIPGLSPAGRRRQTISEVISRRFSIPPPLLAAVVTLFGLEAYRRLSEIWTMSLGAESV